MKTKVSFVTTAFFLAISTIIIIPVQALKTRSISYICTDNGCFSGGTLIVIVKNADGTYTEGVGVKLYKLNNKLMSEFMGTGKTDEDGKFVSILPRGIYYAIVEKDGLEERSKNFYLGNFKKVLITLLEQPSCYEVTVHVQGYSGPMTDLRIYIVDTDLKPIAGPQVPDSNGDTTFSLASGTYKAEALFVNGSRLSSPFTVPDNACVSVVF